MTKQQINIILKELYTVDPSLKAYGPQLESLIRELFALKPNPTIDEAFVASLRSRLINKSAVSYEPETKKGFLDAIINAVNMKRLNYAIGVVAIVAVLVVSTLYVNDQNGNKISFFTPGVKITQAGERAFGELAQVQTAGRGGGGGNNLAMSEGSTSTAAPSAGVGGFGGTADSKMIAPYVPTNYKYVYKGELNLSEAKREVFRRVKGDAVRPDLGGLVDSLGMGLLNLNSFGGKLSSANFVQDGEQPYNIMVNLDEGNVNINAFWNIAWERSIGIAPDCAIKGCEPLPQLKPEDIIPDDEAIRIANDFLSAHNIPSNVYGDPTVQDEWRRMYAAASDKSMVWIPDIVSVIYPLNINGQTVYDEGGNKSGLVVSVNVRNKKVTSVYDLSTLNFQSSMYDAETDASRIMKLVEMGGMYGYSDPSARKTVEIGLGEPTIELVKMWNYKDNKSEELLIPSLVFPVTDQPQDDQFFYRRSVVIPLVKEILDRNPNPGMPMPLEAPATEPAVKITPARG